MSGIQQAQNDIERLKKISADDTAVNQLLQAHTAAESHYAEAEKLRSWSQRNGVDLDAEWKKLEAEKREKGIA